MRGGTRLSFLFWFSITLLFLFQRTLANDSVLSGSFRLRTMNVQGLPKQDEILNSNGLVTVREKLETVREKLVNKQQKIGQKLSNSSVHLWLVQEDFSFKPILSMGSISISMGDILHNALANEMLYSYASTPQDVEDNKWANDGLNRFSEFKIIGTKPEQSTFKSLFIHREEWERCTGSNCLAPKGFSVARNYLNSDPATSTDVYNVHLNSGGEDEDIDARTAQVDQLLKAIEKLSPKRPIIVAGHTNLNLNREGDGPILGTLIETAGLTDTCDVDELNCCSKFTDLEKCHKVLVDRILYRSSDELNLKPTLWEVDSSFLNEGLSDNPAIEVTFNWEKNKLRSSLN